MQMNERNGKERNGKERKENGRKGKERNGKGRRRTHKDGWAKHSVNFVFVSLSASIPNSLMLILFCNYELIKKLILTVVHFFADDVWKYVEFGIFEIKNREDGGLDFNLYLHL